MTDLSKRGKASVSGIIFGTEPQFAEGEMGEIERKEVELEGLSPKRFVIPEIPTASSSGERRRLLAQVNGLETSINADGSLRFAFSLGSGMYATCVMREFMKAHVRCY